MSLKTADIDYIIELIQKITSVAQTKQAQSKLLPLQKSLKLYLVPRWDDIWPFTTQAQEDPLYKSQHRAYGNVKYYLQQQIEETFLNKNLDLSTYAIVTAQECPKVVDELENCKAILEYQLSEIQKPAGTKKKNKKQSPQSPGESKYKPWTKSGDACFIIDDNKIKFYYKGREPKNLRLRSNTNPHKLLFLFAAKNPLPQVDIKDICTKRTRPSDIAKQTNIRLNEKIAAMALPDVPKDIEFVKYNDTSKCYGLWPEIKHKDAVDYE